MALKKNDIYTEKSPLAVAGVVTAPDVPLDTGIIVEGQAVVQLQDFPIGVYSISGGTVVEASIYVKPGATGTIQGTSVISGATYSMRAPTSDYLSQVDFEVTAGEFPVLTIAAGV